MIAPALMFIAMVVVLIFLGLLVLRLRAERRCLAFCWFDMSNWVARCLDEQHQEVIASLGEAKTPFVISNSKEAWGERVDYQIAAMRRAGVRVPTQDDIDRYIVAGP